MASRKEELIQELTDLGVDFDPHDTVELLTDLLESEKAKGTTPPAGEEGKKEDKKPKNERKKAAAVKTDKPSGKGTTPPAAKEDRKKAVYKVVTNVKHNGVFYTKGQELSREEFENTADLDHLVANEWVVFA